MFKIKEITIVDSQFKEESYPIDVDDIRPANMSYHEHWQRIGNHFLDMVDEIYEYQAYLEKVNDTSLVGFYINIYASETDRDSFASCELIPWHGR